MLQCGLENSVGLYRVLIVELVVVPGFFIYIKLIDSAKVRSLFCGV
jgi:hypothetical protein